MTDRRTKGLSVGHPFITIAQESSNVNKLQKKNKKKKHANRAKNVLSVVMSKRLNFGNLQLVGQFFNHSNTFNFSINIPITVE